MALSLQAREEPSLMAMQAIFVCFSAGRIRLPWRLERWSGRLSLEKSSNMWEKAGKGEQEVAGAQAPPLPPP